MKTFIPIVSVTVILILFIGGSSFFLKKEVSQLQQLNLTVDDLNYTTKPLPLVGDSDYRLEHIEALTSFYEIPQNVSDGKSVFHRNDFSAWRPYKKSQLHGDDEIVVYLVSSALYYNSIDNQDSLKKALDIFEFYGDNDSYISLQLITQKQPWESDDFLFVSHSDRLNPFNVLLLQQAIREIETRTTYRELIQLSLNEDFDVVVDPRLYYRASWSLNDPLLSLKAFGKLFYKQWEISLGALLSVVIWFIYLLGLQKFEKRNRMVFLFGFLLTFVLTEAFGPFVYSWLDIFHYNSRSQLLYCLATVGPAEELLKVVPFIMLVFFLKGKEKIDRLILVGFCALGFAACENVGKFDEFGIEILAHRSIICCMGHVATISFGVYIVSLSQRFSGWFVPVKWVGAFIVASVMHGVYDYFLVVGYDFMGLSLVLDFLAIFLLKIMYENALNGSVKFSWSKVEAMDWYREPLILSWLLLIGVQFVLAASVNGVDYAHYNLISSALFLFTYSFLLIRNLIGIKLAKGFHSRIGLLALFQKNDVVTILTSSFQYKWNGVTPISGPIKGELRDQFSLNNDPGYFCWERAGDLQTYVFHVNEVISLRHKNEWACQIFVAPKGEIKQVDEMKLVCSGKMKINKV